MTLGLKEWIDKVTNAIKQLSNVGNYVSDSISSSVSVPTGSWKNITYIDVPPGRWILTARARFASNSTGRRYISISDTSNADDATAEINQNAVASATTIMVLCLPKTLNSTTRLYLTAWQNSGSALNVTSAAISATRIKMGG